MKRIVYALFIALVTNISPQCSVQAMAIRNKQQKEEHSAVLKARMEALKNMQTTQEGQVTPPVDLTISGSSNKVDLTVATSDAYKHRLTAQSSIKDKLASDEEYSFSSEVRLPLSVALLIGGCGLLLIAGSIFLLIKYTAVGRATDRFTATVISMVHAEMANSTDPVTNMRLATLKSSIIEQQRAMNN